MCVFYAEAVPATESSFPARYFVRVYAEAVPATASSIRARYFVRALRRGKVLVVFLNHMKQDLQNMCVRVHVCKYICMCLKANISDQDSVRLVLVCDDIRSIFVYIIYNIHILSVLCVHVCKHVYVCTCVNIFVYMCARV